MVYGVVISAPSAPSSPAQPAPEPASTVPESPDVDPQDPWGCQPCAPEAQAPEHWHLDPFGQKGGGGKKGARPPMACYNCLGLGHPSKLCPSPYGAGEQKSMPKCRNCDGFGHDTPACTSRGGAKYNPPPDFSKGKGKGKDKGKGTGSHWGKGAWGKGKGNVSAFDYAQWQWAQGSAHDAWPPGLSAWMQAAQVAPPPWPGAAAASGNAWPSWPGTSSVRLFTGGFSSIGPVRKAKLHEKPMPLAPLTAPLPTMNRHDALSEYISPEVRPMTAPRASCADFGRIAAPEEFRLNFA